MCEKKEDGLTELFGEPIHVYTRAQALEDGFLVDVSETAREAGIRYPVALTRAVWDEYVTPDPRSVPHGQSEAGRLWDVVWMFRCKARLTRGQAMSFQVIFIMKEKQRRVVTLKAVCGPGDDAAPVITIMKPDED